MSDSVVLSPLEISGYMGSKHTARVKPISALKTASVRELKVIALVVPILHRKLIKIRFEKGSVNRPDTQHNHLLYTDWLRR